MTSRKRYADALQPSTSSSQSNSNGVSMRRSPSSSLSQSNKRSRTYASNAHSRVSQGGGMSLHVLSDVEALEALGLKTDNPALRVALANTQKAMKELISLSHDAQADLDARASGVLCAMLDGVSRHQALVQTPAAPDTDHFDDELTSPKMTLKRRLEIYGCIAKRTSDTLGSLEGAVQQQINAASAAEASLRTQTDRVQAYIDNKLKLLRQKEAEYQDMINQKDQLDTEFVNIARKHFEDLTASQQHDPIARLTYGGHSASGSSDMVVGTPSQNSQNDSGSFADGSATHASGSSISASRKQPPGVNATMLLDLLFEPPPMVAQRIEQRRVASACQEEARKVLHQMNLAVQFAESLRKLLQAVKDDSDTKLGESMRKARQYRSELRNRCVQSLMHHVPLLGSTAVAQVGNLHSRQMAADKRLEKKKQRLADNEELFGDEAPMARADLEKRISEYEGIVTRAKGAVRTVAHEQLSLWKSLLKCSPLGDMEAEANGGGRNNNFQQLNAHGNNIKVEKRQTNKAKQNNSNGVNAAANTVAGVTGFSFDLSIIDTDDEDEVKDNDNVDLDDAATVVGSSPVYNNVDLEGHQIRAREQARQRENMNQLDHTQRTRFLPDQVLGAMQSALKHMSESSADNDLNVVPHVMLPIIGRLIEARSSPPSDPQALWHHNHNSSSSSSSSTSQFTSAGIAAPAAADGPSPQQNESSFSGMGQARNQSRQAAAQIGRSNGDTGPVSNGSTNGFAPSYLVPPVGMDAEKQTDAQTELVSTNGVGETNGKAEKCTIM